MLKVIINHIVEFYLVLLMQQKDFIMMD
jgi:hypothetical protein